MSGIPERVKDNILIKGVIEILSSNHKLGGLKFHEDKIGNSTCIDGYRSVLADSSNSKAVWGYCFICGIGTPRPVIWIKQDTFLTPFLCSILKLLWGIEKQIIFMSRSLTIEEKDSLLKLIKKEGEFIFKGRSIPKTLIKIGALLESSTLDSKENKISFNGSCEFSPELEEFPQSTIPGLYEGSAKMIGLKKFELRNPIILRNR